MSFDIRSSRALSNDPFGRTLAELSKKLSAFLSKDQAAQVENPEDIYADAQDVESVVKYHSFVAAKKFPLNFYYSSASEPDYNKVKLYLGVVWPNLGNKMTDLSGFGNHADIIGDPVLVDGAPFDAGIVDGITTNTKSVAVKFNRPASKLVNREYLSIPDNAGLQVTGITTGISYFIRFRVHSLADEASFTSTLIAKSDDITTPDNAVLIQVKTDGAMNFHVKRAGTSYNARTATGAIVADTVYDCWFTYANSGNVQHIWINNVDKWLTDPGAPSYPKESTKMKIMTRHPDNGHIYGDFYHAVVIRDKVVSSTEVGHHFTNKWTLADIAFGEVPVSNYSASHTQATASFTSTSFTSTSFTQ